MAKAPAPALEALPVTTAVNPTVNASLLYVPIGNAPFASTASLFDFLFSHPYVAAGAMPTSACFTVSLFDFLLCHHPRCCLGNTTHINLAPRSNWWEPLSWSCMTFQN